MAVAANASGRSYAFKVVLLGEGCVGKTSVVLRYVQNKFNDKHITTLQVRQRGRETIMVLSVMSLAFFFFFLDVRLKSKLEKSEASI